MEQEQANTDANGASRRVSFSKKDIGRFGEDAAAEMLICDGYDILSRNYRFGRYGEIDIVARKRDAICFVEVKSRSSDAFGSPAEAVGWQKRQKIKTVAAHFLATRQANRESRRSPAQAQARFDVVEVYVRQGDDGCFQVLSVRHIVDAFQD